MFRCLGLIEGPHVYAVTNLKLSILSLQSMRKKV